MVMYRIKKLQKDKARKIGVEIKPSKLKGKKIDVYKKGKKIASIGAKGYSDYATYIETKGLEYANKRRKLYKIRHNKNRKKVGSRSYYADQILW
tara:strand:+ start:129 stop:410 length:282 start_codon:yes stop_codon:yes gene_type:complete